MFLPAMAKSYVAVGCVGTTIELVT
jgi:hypothetical protein